MERLGFALKIALSAVIFAFFLVALDFWRQRAEVPAKEAACEAAGGRVERGGEGFSCAYDFSGGRK